MTVREDIGTLAASERRLGGLTLPAWQRLLTIGVVIAALLLGEAVTGLDMIGVAIAAGGILAVQVARIRAGA